MRNFKELKIWQKGFQIAISSYKITETFPVNERFGLISQINRRRYLYHQILQKAAAAVAGRSTNTIYKSP